MPRVAWKREVEVVPGDGKPPIGLVFENGFALSCAVDDSTSRMIPGSEDLEPKNAEEI